MLRALLVYSISYLGQDCVASFPQNWPTLSSNLLSWMVPKIFTCCIAPTLTMIINESLATGTVPDILKLANVCPLHKNGDPWLPQLQANLSSAYHIKASWESGPQTTGRALAAPLQRPWSSSRTVCIPTSPLMWGCTHSSRQQLATHAGWRVNLRGCFCGYEQSVR